MNRVVPPVPINTTSVPTSNKAALWAPWMPLANASAVSNAIMKNELPKSWRHLSAWDYRLMPESGKEDIVFYDKVNQQWYSSSDVSLLELVVYVHKCACSGPNTLPTPMANSGRVLRTIIQNKVKEHLESLLEDAFKLSSNSANAAMDIDKVAETANASVPAENSETTLVVSASDSAARPRVPSAPFLEPGEHISIESSVSPTGPADASLVEKAAPPAEVNRSRSAETLFDGATASEAVGINGEAANTVESAETTDQEVLEAALQLGALHGNARVSKTAAVKAEGADRKPSSAGTDAVARTILDWDKLNLWVFNIFQPVPMFAHGTISHEPMTMAPVPARRMAPVSFKGVSLVQQHMSGAPMPPHTSMSTPQVAPPVMHPVNVGHIPHGAPMTEHIVHADPRYYSHDHSHVYSPASTYYGHNTTYPHVPVAAVPGEPTFGNYFAEDSSSTAYYGGDLPREPSPQFVVPPAEGKKIKARSVERNIDYNVQNRLYRYRVKHKGARLSGPWRRTIQEARHDLERWRIQHHLRVPF